MKTKQQREKQNRIGFFSLLILVVFLLGGMVQARLAEDALIQKKENRMLIVTTLFPTYDFVKEMVGDAADVVLLLPPGVEAHAYEPTPRDIVLLSKADLFIYTSDVMEPWAKRVAAAASLEPVRIVDASVNIEMEDTLPQAGQEVVEEQDPHIWLDMAKASRMVDNILAGLQASPLYQSTFETNARAYQQELARLDTDFAEAIAGLANKTIVFGGHFAFGYFAKRYGMDFITPYRSFAPDAEPTPQMMVAIIKEMKTQTHQTIYYEEIVDPKVASILSEETGAKMLVLHSAHNITKQELRDEVSFIELMRGNIEKLKEGLGYVTTN
ncbi:MAG: metal ABC transporter solute-binding protein, Zn/Mn family [Erysipelotrichaceae bacterium]